MAAAADASNGGLQEVVVTARKREENLQDVPISIGVFCKQDMQNLAITSLMTWCAACPRCPPPAPARAPRCS